MRPDMTVSIDNNDICKLLRAIDAQTKAITKLTEEVSHLRSDLIDKESLETEKKCCMNAYLNENMPVGRWNEDTIGNIVAETETKNDG